MVWGVHVYRSGDGGHSWEVLPSAPHVENDSSDLKAIWYLAAGHADHPATLYAGVEPAGLFVSADRGDSWHSVPGLNEHPTRGRWQPAKGGLALHSIYVDPRKAQRMYAAVSAGGVYRSDDGGSTWSPANRGVRPALIEAMTAARIGSRSRRGFPATSATPSPPTPAIPTPSTSFPKRAATCGRPWEARSRSIAAATAARTGSR